MLHSTEINLFSTNDWFYKGCGTFLALVTKCAFFSLLINSNLDITNGDIMKYQLLQSE